MLNSLKIDLSNLNPGQFAAATVESNALVWAGPGTGKTQVAASRAGWLLETGRCKPHELLVVTFTNRAVNEFRERLESLLGASLAAQVRISTFHSLALSLVEMEGQLNGRGRLRLLSSEARVQLLEELVTKLQKNQPIAAPTAQVTISAHLSRKDTAKEVGQLISQFKAWDIFKPQSSLSHLKGVSEAVAVPNWQQDDAVWKLARTVYSHYSQHLKANRLLDLDDLIPGATLTLKNHPKLVRLPGVGVRQILLDETQDTSPQQLALLLGLIEATELEFSDGAKPKGSGSTGFTTQLVAVGDERQQIFNYLHAGGAYDRLRQSLHRPVQLNLDIEYRYGPTVNRAATAISWSLGYEAVTHSARSLDDPKKRFVKLLESFNAAYGQLPITVYQAEDEAEEGDFVATEIERVRLSQPAATIAILVRTHRQIELIRQLLNARNMPYQTLGSNASSDEPASIPPQAQAQVQGGTISPQAPDQIKPPINKPAPVIISTIHASKGAEFEVVFVTGLAQGLFPAGQGKILEDLRLFFVAVTRVQYLLYLSYPVSIEERARTGQATGRRKLTAPSTFLTILP